MFPYQFQGDFESGDFSQFATVTNPGTPAQMTVMHYTEMVQKGIGEVPYRGAYAQVCDLSRGSADAFVAPAAITPVATSAVRFYVCVGLNLRMGIGDLCTLARIDCGADQTSLVLDNTTGTPRLDVTGTYAAAQHRYSALTLGQWLCIEAEAIGANMQCYINGGTNGVPLTGLASAGVTGVRLGTTGIDAGTTTGYVAYDQLAVDDTRLAPYPERYPQIIQVKGSGVVIPGSGRYARINLIAGHASDNTLALYDSDVAGTGPEELLAPILTSELANRDYHPGRQAGYFTYGLKVVMTGTAPQALIVLGHAMCSAGVIAEYARRRPLRRVA